MRAVSRVCSGVPLGLTVAELGAPHFLSSKLSKEMGG